MRSKLLNLFMGVVFMASGASAAVTDADLKDRQTFGDYEVTIDRDQKNGREHLRILRDGQEVFSDEGNSYRIGLMYEEMPADELVKIGKDITGDGEPNLVVAHWSGGAHCCFTYAVFNIGKDFYVIDVIDGGDGDLSTFEDVDQDGALEFIGRDWTFSYWHASFAASPAPQIVLKYRDGKYRLALNLMEQPLPSLEDQEALLSQVKEEVLKRIQEDMQKFGKTNADHFGWVNHDFMLTSTVWGHMIDLIYTGHPNEAWLFLDKVYPQESPEKELFKKDFMRKLAESQYWDSIQQIFDDPLVAQTNDSEIEPLTDEQWERMDSFCEVIDQIRMGMNKHEVEQILGAPDFINNEPSLSIENQTDVWTYEHPIIAIAKYVISFDNSLVIFKTFIVQSTDNSLQYLDYADFCGSPSSENKS